ncbi:hypothetical protein ACWOE3_11425 [Enterococcus dispar]|uniref:Uncharacterized protein n=1 Tax=Enterococcus dispar ATCC 51266 TaxID=1139219 RepID=S0KRV4_9ENTE|nr:hypothetical protein [Enterococcus dispar]EOT43745.1 hypothetical protein OMK_00303 [Enterococcus dispar ATCC 51266]EOW85583.1 hypothetical protein I569_00896 [Enterococcus dispar ATCC 51266]MCU7358157.1 hypothetical protein [Enterococcus dispar]MDT2705674.1 hypothetical protein [Enterococcus dispar]OJG37752.1 hypothetical protein RV01_GL001148 [Enterococcus dispar]
MQLSKEQTTRLLEQMDFITFQEKVIEYFDGEEVDFNVYYIKNRKNGSVLATTPKSAYLETNEGIGKRYVMGYASTLWEQFAPVDKEDFVARHVKAFFDQNSHLSKNYDALVKDIELGAKYRFFLLEPLLRDLELWAEKRAHDLQDKKRHSSPILRELMQLKNTQFENFCVHHFEIADYYNQLVLLVENHPVCYLSPDYELTNYGYAVDFWLHYSGEDTSVDLEEELNAFVTSFLNGDQNYHSRFLSSISIRQELTEEILLKISTLLNDLEYWATRRLAKKVEL